MMNGDISIEGVDRLTAAFVLRALASSLAMMVGIHSYRFSQEDRDLFREIGQHLEMNAYNIENPASSGIGVTYIKAP